MPSPRAHPLERSGARTRRLRWLRPPARRRQVAIAMGRPVLGFLTLGLAVFATFGCASYGAHLTATPTPPGQHEVAVHADALVTTPNPGTQQARPSTELGFRWGLTNDIDVGVRGHGMGAEINSRLRLASSNGFDFTASPFVGGGLIPNHQNNAGALRFPMGVRALVSWHAPANLDLTLGATGTFEPQAELGTGQRSQLLAAPGVLFGTQFPLSETIELNLEVNVHTPYALGEGRWQGIVMQGGVGLKWLAF